MTNENSYELADRIAVIKGRRADGVIVQMHQLTQGFDHNEVLKLAITYLLHNPPASGGLILDLVQRDGLTYLVTADKPQCLELQDWLTREVGHVTPKAEVTAELPHAAPQKVAEPSPAQTPEPEARLASPATAPQPAPSTLPPAGPSPAIDPLAAPAVALPAFLGSPQAPVTPPSPEAPTVYVIAQPKAGVAKSILFTVIGFLVVAAVFWIAMLVVRGMK